VKKGRWVGFNIESKASHIYWLDRATISIKCNIRFNRDYILVPSSTPTTDAVPTEPTADTDSPNSVPKATVDTEVLTCGTGETQARGTRVKCPSQYIQHICIGEGTATGDNSRLPLGVQTVSITKITETLRPRDPQDHQGR